jgi:hypothetical protein
MCLAIEWYKNRHISNTAANTKRNKWFSDPIFKLDSRKLYQQIREVSGFRMMYKSFLLDQYTSDYLRFTIGPISISQPHYLGWS